MASARVSPGAKMSDEWLTPPEIIQKIGPFDLDPCAPFPRPWDTADRHYSIEQDGLSRPWEGRVWLNPPYSDVATWIRRLAAHGDGVALIFARVDTKWFHEEVFSKANAILFMMGRPIFYTKEGKKAKWNGGAPSVLVAYGRENVRAIERIPGFPMYLR